MLELLNIGGSAEEQARLAVLLAQYADVFALKEEDLVYTDKVQHEIHLLDDVSSYPALPTSTSNAVQRG